MRELTNIPDYFKLKSYQVINEFKDLKDNLDANNTAKANVVVKVKKEYFSNSVGNGPVNALDNALRSVLIKSYPILKKVNNCFDLVLVIYRENHWFKYLFLDHGYRAFLSIPQFL